jgi:FkbM family methyltransferase
MLEAVSKGSNMGIDGTQHAIQDDLVYDVGAHLGEDSDFYLKLGYRVVAVEANPALVEKLRHRFENEIAAGRYSLIPRAIGTADAEVTFYVNKTFSVWGTANADWASHEHRGPSEQIKVRSTRFLDILNEHGCPKYLKIDIEGADMLCVYDLISFGTSPPFLSIESTKLSWADLIAEFDALERLGYTAFQVVGQGKHDGGLFRTRTGEPLQYTFEDGAAGRFGEYLDGQWLTREQALRRYERIFFLYRTIGDNTPLRKLLRNIPLLRHVLGLVSWYDTHAMKN